MTAFTPQDSSVLLILGEVRGDVKGIARSLATLDAHINAVEATSDARFSKLEGRVGGLEAIKIRIGGLALGVGIFSGFAAPKIIPAILAALGG